MSDEDQVQKRPEQPYRTIDKFDREIGTLKGRPDVTETKASTIVTTTPMIGATRTFIVQTFRVREVGDSIAVQYIDDNGSMRIVLPPEVADAIARQRDALTLKVRKRLGKEQASARKARGEVPAFLKAGKRGKRKRKRKTTAESPEPS